MSSYKICNDQYRPQKNIQPTSCCQTLSTRFRYYTKHRNKKTIVFLFLWTMLSERDREGKKQREPQNQKKSGACLQLHGPAVRSKDVGSFDTQNHKTSLSYSLPTNHSLNLNTNQNCFSFFALKFRLHLSKGRNTKGRESFLSFVSSSDFQDEDTVWCMWESSCYTDMLCRWGCFVR